MKFATTTAASLLVLFETAMAVEAQFQPVCASDPNHTECQPHDEQGVFSSSHPQHGLHDMHGMVQDHQDLLFPQHVGHHPAHNDHEYDPSSSSLPQFTCRLWMSESSLHRGKLGIFSGVPIHPGQSIGDGDLHIPIFDPNMNEYSIWHDTTWNGDVQDDLLLQNFYRLQSFLPGIGSSILCSETMGNVSPRRKELVDSEKVHRSQHPSAGSFTYRHGMKFQATQPIIAGQELFTSCGRPPNMPTTEEEEEQEGYEKDEGEEGYEEGWMDGWKRRSESKEMRDSDFFLQQKKGAWWVVISFAYITNTRSHTVGFVSIESLQSSLQQ